MRKREKELLEREKERERVRERIKTRREKREKLSNVARVRNDSRSVPAFSKFSKNLPACPFERLFTRYFSLVSLSPRPSSPFHAVFRLKLRKHEERRRGTRWISLRRYVVPYEYFFPSPPSIIHRYFARV